MSQNVAVVSSVSASATAVVLFNPVGVGTGSGSDSVSRMVFNDSTVTLYLKYGAAASSTDHTVQIPAAGYYEFPAPAYDGLATGTWASATGAARLTEVTV